MHRPCFRMHWNAYHREASFHGTSGGVERTATLVFEESARFHDGIQSDHASALHFLHLPISRRDHPMPRFELQRTHPHCWSGAQANILWSGRLAWDVRAEQSAGMYMRI